MMANDAFTPIIWSKNIESALAKELVMGHLVNTRYEGEIKAMGNVVNIPNIGSVVVKDYTRGQTLSIDGLTHSITPLTIDQQKYFAFRVDDVEQAQSQQNIMDAYAGQAAMAIKEVIDAHLFAHYGEVPTGQTLGASSPIALSKANIYEQITLLGEVLDEKNVPQTGRKLVIAPKVKTLLLQSDAFTRASTLGDDVIKNGMVGRIAGFDVHVSNTVPTLVGGVLPILAFTSEFVTFASQVAKTEVVRPADEFSAIFRGLYLYGSKVLHPECAALLKGTIA